MSEKPAYILDSFAVIAYLNDEEGSDKVEELLDRAYEGEINLFMHAMNLGEVLYTVFREAGEIQAMNVNKKAAMLRVNM